MTDPNAFTGEPETSSSTTWPQLRAAAASWASAQLADLYLDEPESDLDLLPDFEAEP